MARIKQELNKTSQNAIQRLERKMKNYPFITEPQTFIAKYREMLTNEVRSQKTCSEKSVTEYFMKNTFSMLDAMNTWSDDFFKNLKKNARRDLAKHYTDSPTKTYDNNIDIYFNEVKREYINCPQNESEDLEFLPENRDVFIKNNLKLVINCAKKYQNLGLPFEDLIQFGNLGLLVAFDRFDKDRANLRIKIHSLINEHESDVFTRNEAESIIHKGFTYSKNIETTIDALPEEGFKTKDEFHTWVNKNVKTAVFSSVAFKWIRAYILNELTRLGSIIHVPKSVKGKIDEETGEEVKETITIINLDSFNPYTNDNYHDNELNEVTQEEFIIEDERIANVERQEALKQIVGDALYKLNPVDRRIVKKRYGIDLPYAMSVNDIAENENISVNKVKYSLQQSMKLLAESFSEIDIDTINDLIN